MSIACAPWMQLLDGSQFFLLKPKIDREQIGMIAKVLSRVPRFAGHSKEFYSVGQHSVLVHDILVRHFAVDCVHPKFSLEVRRKLRLAALLHDAFVGDITSPMKAALHEADRSGGGAYALELMQIRIDHAICKAFGLGRMDFEDSRIKHADLCALATEKRDLMEKEPAAWVCLPEPDRFIIRPWFMQEAEEQFLAAYRALV